MLYTTRVIMVPMRDDSLADGSVLLQKGVLESCKP